MKKSSKLRYWISFTLIFVAIVASFINIFADSSILVAVYAISIFVSVVLLLFSPPHTYTNSDLEKISDKEAS